MRDAFVESLNEDQLKKLDVIIDFLLFLRDRKIFSIEDIGKTNPHVEDFLLQDVDT